MPYQPVFVDDVVVERAVAGERMPMNKREREASVKRLHRCCLKDGEIADRLGISVRTVVRVRARLGLPALYDSGRNFIGAST